MNTITLNISGPAMMMVLILVTILAFCFILDFFNSRLRRLVEKHRQENIELMQEILHEECMKTTDLE